MSGRFPFGRWTGGPDESERPVDTFMRGLFSGALVGAVIAGSAIWERRQRRRRSATEAPATGELGDAGTRGGESQSVGPESDSS